MAQLWGGRFTGETDALVYRFNASIGFDKKLFGQDVEGSIAHVVMLEKQGIITCEEKDAIVKGLTQIRKDVEEGKLAITDQYEDIHSFVEAELIRRIGDAGKKMHTGRSRNIGRCHCHEAACRRLCGGLFPGRRRKIESISLRRV